MQENESLEFRNQQVCGGCACGCKGCGGVVVGVRRCGCGERVRE